MPENKENSSPKIKVKRNESDLKFDIADDNDRIVYTLHCINKLHFYFIDFAIKRSKTFKEVQQWLKEIKDAKEENFK